MKNKIIVYNSSYFFNLINLLIEISVLVSILYYTKIWYCQYFWNRALFNIFFIFILNFKMEFNRILSSALALK